MNRLFQILSIVVIGIALFKIVFLLNFWVIPLLFLFMGLIAGLINQKFSLYLFVFLFPFINASPELFKSDYPFNYIAPALFLLSGIVIASTVCCLKKSKSEEWCDFALKHEQGFFFYYLFLIMLGISTIFVFLRWSNIGLGGYASLGADTPVAPEVLFFTQSTEPQRISFASIFPVVSLFIYFIAPYVFFLIKKFNPKENEIFKWLSFGFYISVALAVVQKISGRSLISDRLGKDLKQFYGGFSDFNAFGFFSGVMFLWSTYEIRNKNLLGYITFVVSLGGTVLSGSRTAFFFILAGVGNLVFSALRDRKKQQKTVVFILIAVVIALVIFAGGTLTKRLSEGFSENENLFKKVNAITNGRLWMTLFSLETIRDYFVPGVGTGNFTFYLAYKNYIPAKQSGERYVYDLPLNHYLLIFTENGALSFFFFTGFMIYMFLRSRKKLLLGTILVALLLNNFFWFPENYLLFWILAGLSDMGVELSPGKKFFLPVKKKPIVIISLVLFFIGNSVSYKSLHPVHWAEADGYRYDYGFWYGETNQNGDQFHWTKEQAGMYLSLSATGVSQEFKLFCGAPLEHLKGKHQSISIYWKGKLYKNINFLENKTETFRIEDSPFGKGFLEIVVAPVFNIKKLNLGGESRDLGIQFFVSQSKNIN